MELRAIVLMIVKIVISIPTLLIVSQRAECTTLMGGHLDNGSKSHNFTNLLLEEIDQSSLKENLKEQKTTETPPYTAETIPNPSPLVVPGYNLPDSLFNKGKPFYLEKNPVTGEFDFSLKAQDTSRDDYEYYDDTNPNLFDKSNIDRKDGNVGSHKYNDINQLTPNFHDIMISPAEYNPEKYGYPLISSSYANTKVQGNVNKYHNHKNYEATTYKPTKTPTYVSTKYSYFGIEEKSTTTTEAPTTTTAKARTTTTSEVYLTTPEKNLMNSPMYHPIFHDNYSTEKKKIDDIFLTTTVPSTTSKRTLSLFEQFLESYDDMDATTKKIEVDEDYNINGHAGPYNHNVLTGSNMAHYEYEYEDGVTDNIAVENQPVITQLKTTNKEGIEETSTTARTTTKDSSTSTTSTTTSTTTQRTTTTTLGTTTSVPTTTTTTTTPKTTTAILTSTRTTTEPIIQIKAEEVYQKTYIKPTTLHPPFTPKVTSMPLGDFYNNQPIIVATQNLRDQLNSEKVPKPFEPSRIPAAPSSSNIRIPANQNTVSFVIGNQQSVGNEYTGFKESPFDNKPFRPVYADYGDTASYQVQTSINMKPQKPYSIGASSIMHPIKNSETSLAIGVPVDMIQKKPGQVVDDSMEIYNAQIEFPKGNGPKIVFPDERDDEKSTLMPEQHNEEQNYKPEIQNKYATSDGQNYKTDGQNYKSDQLSLPTTILPNNNNNNNNNIRKHYNAIQMNREVLKLNSKPMLHQLPSDLTPPSEPVTRIHLNRERPPWDPRPGHFHAGRPEYARPPRPNDVYKRIDNLPNILPQFRPNIKPPHYFDHHPSKGYIRQPLLDRPSNRPVGFFEKLQPPPPPKHLHNLRKIPQLEQQSSPPPQQLQQQQQLLLQLQQQQLLLQQQPQQQQETKPRNPVLVAEDRTSNKKTTPEQYMFYQTPPKVVLAQRRNGDTNVEVETLQMIQAKQEKVEKIKDEPVTAPLATNLDKEIPIYVVYPVNAAPVKLDALDTNKKETVVIGKRAELPLPPSQIQDFDPSEFNLHERHDSPILKPHPKPSFPTKTDFPYPLERPDPSLLSAPDVANNIDNVPKFETNDWDTIEDTESRIVNPKTQQISVKLKTYTEKPIAVAYTPTEPHRTEKYSAPNYASPVIPEIRNTEITVSAVMHTNPKTEHDVSLKNQIYHDKYTPKPDLDNETPNIPKLDFQAPFQASVNIDNISSNGWSVVRDRSKPEEIETTTQPIITTSKFDIEKFNPPLIGGFKPIYDFPDEDSDKETEIKERQE